VDVPSGNLMSSGNQKSKGISGVGNVAVGSAGLAGGVAGLGGVACRCGCVGGRCVGGTTGRVRCPLNKTTETRATKTIATNDDDCFIQMNFFLLGS